MKGSSKHYSVDELLERKYFPAKKEYYYKVKWTGYSLEESTWEPDSIISKDLPKMVEEFNLLHEKKKPKKAAPKVVMKPRKITIRPPKSIKILKEEGKLENGNLADSLRSEFFALLAEKRKAFYELGEGFGDFSRDVPDFISKHYFLTENSDKQMISDAVFKLQWKPNPLKKRKAQGTYFTYEVMQEKCPQILLEYIKKKALLKSTD